MQNSGPYSALDNDIISYNGNNVRRTSKNIKKNSLSSSLFNHRVKDLMSERIYYHLHRIDDSIFHGVIEYFDHIGAQWCNLPLTTLMISSPGEVYAGRQLDYTTDALPVELKWFESKRNIFLSESSQFYLELRLLINEVDKVFSIYNSFRKEKSDFTHLSEFQHVEFEGHISFNENLDFATGLLRYLTSYILKNNQDALKYFLKESEIALLYDTFDKKNLEVVTFKEVLNRLYKSTGNKKYKEFSLKNFSAWEEIKITEICKKHVIITEFPLKQIPFYHNALKTVDGHPVAENADIILYGYREVIGSGLRISDPQVLMQKAKRIQPTKKRLFSLCAITETQ
ncbi:MAG TPA: amino acid--tRNA ligase-related protein [Patescibacteria group bacterium]|nr:amino acid--tRNA ligase-related protein [Patescibacteria group bacterium]